MNAHRIVLQLCSLVVVGLLALPVMAQQPGSAPMRPMEMAPNGMEPRDMEARGMDPRGMGPANTGRPLDAQPTAAPFQLTPEQEKYLDEVLAAWEAHTTKVSTFTCKFTRWDYIPGFVPGDVNNQTPALVNDGLLKYSTPDKGSFEITKTKRLKLPDPKKPELKSEYEPDPDSASEHWVCNGLSIWEYNAKLKQVIERPIPPEMRGKAIKDGPLPFLFGAEARSLKRRYFLRIITPQELAEKEIWVDAFPRFRNDAANFKRSILRLKRDDFEPAALRVYDPGDRFCSYQFEDVRINSTLDKLRDAFMPPRVPFGWQKIREENQAAAPPAPAGDAQAAPREGSAQRPYRPFR